MLDAFYGSLCGTSEFVHGISDRGFAKARSRLHMPALTWLNDWLLQRVDSMVWVLRWHGLRVVLGDASALMPATRAMLAEALECLGPGDVFGARSRLPGGVADPTAQRARHSLRQSL